MDRNKKYKKDVNDEVEELLRAAEDAALLKLSLNSHNVHASPSDLDPDLDKRFRDLKSGSKSKTKKEIRTEKMTMPKSDKVNEEVEEDDLLARFFALKASLPKPSSSSLVGVETSDTSFGDGLGDGKSGGKDNIDDEDEDEVDKIVRWAMDAARLDPSPSSDDEDTFKENDSDDDDDASHETSEEEDTKNSRKNSKKKQKYMWIERKDVVLRSISLDVVLNRFPGIQRHHLEYLTVALRVVGVYR